MPKKGTPKPTRSKSAGASPRNRGSLLRGCLRWMCILIGVAIAIVAVALGILRQNHELRHKFSAAVLQKISFSMHEEMLDKKNEIFAGVGGSILEIGAGPGVNFDLYPAGSSVQVVEPNENFQHSLNQMQANHPHLRINFVQGEMANLSAVSDNSVDNVVMTLVMCTVEDVEMGLQEVKRVLKPGGSLRFVDHVLAAESRPVIRKLQHWFTPVWTIIGDGCEMDRDTAATIEAAGFSSVSYKRDDTPVFFPIIYGVAVK